MKFCINISESYGQMKYFRQNKTFMFEVDPPGKCAPGIARILHKSWLIKICLQTEPQVEIKDKVQFVLY